MANRLNPGCGCCTAPVYLDSSGSFSFGLAGYSQACRFKYQMLPPPLIRVHAVHVDAGNRLWYASSEGGVYRVTRYRDRRTKLTIEQEWYPQGGPLISAWGLARSGSICIGTAETEVFGQTRTIESYHADGDLLWSRNIGDIFDADHLLPLEVDEEVDHGTYESRAVTIMQIHADYAGNWYVMASVTLSQDDQVDHARVWCLSPEGETKWIKGVYPAPRPTADGEVYHAVITPTLAVANDGNWWVNDNYYLRRYDASGNRLKLVDGQSQAGFFLHGQKPQTDRYGYLYVMRTINDEPGIEDGTLCLAVYTPDGNRMHVVEWGHGTKLFAVADAADIVYIYGIFDGLPYAADGQVDLIAYNWINDEIVYSHHRDTPPEDWRALGAALNVLARPGAANIRSAPLEESEESEEPPDV